MTRLPNPLRNRQAEHLKSLDNKSNQELSNHIPYTDYSLPSTGTCTGDSLQTTVYRDKSTYTDIEIDSVSVPTVSPAGQGATTGKPVAPACSDIDLFTLEQITAIGEKHKIEGAAEFWNEMHAAGWVLFNKPIEKANIVKAFRGWAKYRRPPEAPGSGNSICQIKQVKTVDDNFKRKFYKIITDYIPYEVFKEYACPREDYDDYDDGFEDLIYAYVPSSAFRGRPFKDWIFKYFDLDVDDLLDVPTECFKEVKDRLSHKRKVEPEEDSEYSTALQYYYTGSRT